MRVASLREPSAGARIANGLQTALLLGLMVTVGGVLGNALLGGWGFALAVAFAVLTFLFGSAGTGRMVISMYRARAVGHADSPALHGAIRELARRADLAAVPRLFLSPLRTPNALSVGADDDPAIVLTAGLLARLGGRELAGVLAHEIAHIRNRDLWLLSLADSVRRFTRGLSLFGLLVILLNLPLLLFRGMALPPGTLLLLFAAPFLSLLMELALSRTREFEADRTAVELTGDPEGFASALRSLELSQRGFWDLLLPRGEPAGGKLLRTHPSTDERVLRIREPHRL